SWKRKHSAVKVWNYGTDIYACMGIYKKVHVCNSSYICSYTILAYFFPLIRIHQDISIIYLFIMLSTICGSLANTTIFAMGDRDYLNDSCNAC
ncbi:MAG: hypothetical protein ACLR7D_03785, partial [Lachnospira eligens]